MLYYYFLYSFKIKSKITNSSTQERDEWVQLFRDFLLRLEVTRVRTSLLSLLDDLPEPQPFAEAETQRHVEFFISGIKSDCNKSINQGGCGQKMEKPPTQDLKMKLPDEDQFYARTLSTTTAGQVTISKKMLGFMKASSVVIPLKDLTIRVNINNFNVFTMIGDEGIYSAEIASKKEDRNSRDAYVNWLLYVKAMEPMLASIPERWFRVTDIRTKTPAFCENCDNPRISFLDFPKGVEMITSADHNKIKCYSRPDNTAAAVVELAGGRIAANVVYDLNELFQQTTDETHGLHYAEPSLEHEDDLEQTRPLLTYNYKPLHTPIEYNSDTVIPRYPAPWEDVTEWGSRVKEVRILHGERIQFLEFLQKGNCVDDWFYLPIGAEEEEIDLYDDIQLYSDDDSLYSNTVTTLLSSSEESLGEDGLPRNSTTDDNSISEEENESVLEIPIMTLDRLSPKLDIAGIGKPEYIPKESSTSTTSPREYKKILTKISNNVDNVTAVSPHNVDATAPQSAINRLNKVHNNLVTGSSLTEAYINYAGTTTPSVSPGSQRQQQLPVKPNTSSSTISDWKSGVTPANVPSNQLQSVPDLLPESKLLKALKKCAPEGAKPIVARIVEDTTTVSESFTDCWCSIEGQGHSITVTAQTTSGVYSQPIKDIKNITPNGTTDFIIVGGGGTWTFRTTPEERNVWMSRINIATRNPNTTIRSNPTRMRISMEKSSFGIAASILSSNNLYGGVTSSHRPRQQVESLFSTPRDRWQATG